MYLLNVSTTKQSLIKAGQYEKRNLENLLKNKYIKYIEEFDPLQIVRMWILVGHCAELH